MREVNCALDEIHQGRSVYATAKKYNIPLSTLRRKRDSDQPNKKSGPPTVLTAEEEAGIVKWMFCLNDQGFPVTKNTLIRSVAQLVKNRDNPFTDGKPGRHWYEKFVKRHPDISLLISQNLYQSRSIATEDCLRAWSKEVEELLEEKQLLNIDGSRIFNIDEAAFSFCPKSKQLVMKRAKKTHGNCTNNDEENCSTVLFSVSTSGALAPPMVVFKLKNFSHSLAQSIPHGWIMGKSESGWQTAETFYEYICNTFEPWLTANEAIRPVILYVDVHSSHITTSLIEFCTEKQIELVARPDETQLVQPLDIGFLKPLQEKWTICLAEWRLVNQRKMRVQDFAPLLQNAVSQLNISQSMKKSFEATSIYPYSTDPLDYNHPSKKNKRARETDASPTVANSNVAADIALQHLESYLGSSLLREFKSAYQRGSWNGAIEYLRLYFYWQDVLESSSN